MGLLIAICRGCIGILAVAITLGGGLAGWFIGRASGGSEGFAADPTQVLNGQLICIALGLVAGLVVAGSSLGLVAAVLDMQRSLRIIASRRTMPIYDDDLASRARQTRSELQTPEV